MGCNPPLVAGRVFHPRAAVSIKLIGRSHGRSGSSLEGALVGSVGIVDIEVQGARRRLLLIPRLAQHHD